MIRQAFIACILVITSTQPAAAIPLGIQTGWNDTLSLWLGAFAFMAMTSGLALHAAKPPNIAFSAVHTAQISRVAKVYRAIFDFTLMGCVMIAFFGPYAMGEWEVQRTEDIEAGIHRMLDGPQKPDRSLPDATPNYN